ncbi:MAG TPA: XapX domain-containing protein [Usitatibacteraceae bacterium]
MKPYVIALGAGILVGVIYALLKVRSPAPPVIALAGLLGMLIGEQLVPIALQWYNGEKLTISQMSEDSKEHIFGNLPSREKKT